jgi:hypothetical protein
MFAAYTFRSIKAILAKALQYLFPCCKIEFEDQDEDREVSRESVTESIEKYVV